MRFKMPKLPKLRLPKFKVPRSVAETAVQLSGVALALVGVAHWSTALAEVLGGFLIVLAVERQAK